MFLVSAFASSVELEEIEINSERSGTHKNNHGDDFPQTVVVPFRATAASALRFLSFPTEAFVGIGVYLKNPCILGCFNKNMRVRVKDEITLQKVFARRYGFSLSPNPDFSEELIWFLRPPLYHPDSLVMRHFVESVSTALISRTFPHNEGAIAESMINYITSPALSRSDLEFFSAPKMLRKHESYHSTAESLTLYSMKIKRYALTAKMLQLFPSYFSSCICAVVIHDSTCTLKDLQDFYEELGPERFFNQMELSIKSIPMFNHECIPFLTINDTILGVSLIIGVLLSPPEFMTAKILFSSFENEEKLPVFFKESFELFCNSDVQLDHIVEDISCRNLAILAEFRKVFKEFKDSRINVNYLEILNRIRFDPEYSAEAADSDFQSLSSDHLQGLAIAAIKGKRTDCLEILLNRIVLECDTLDDSLMNALGTFSEHSALIIGQLKRSNNSSSTLHTFFRYYAVNFNDKQYLGAILKEGLGYSSIDEYIKDPAISSERIHWMFGIFSKFYTNPALLETLLSFRDAHCFDYTFEALRVILQFQISSPSASEEEGGDFIECLKVVLKSSYKLKYKIGFTFTASHGIIRRIFKNQDLHAIFKAITIQMSLASVLEVIRNPFLLGEFLDFFSTFGRKIKFDTGYVLNYLTRDSEFKALTCLTGLEIGEILISIREKSTDSMFYYKHRSAFLFWLHTGSLLDRLWECIPVEDLHLLYLDAPEALKLSAEDLRSSESESKSKRSSDKLVKIEIKIESVLYGTSILETDTQPASETQTETEDIL